MKKQKSQPESATQSLKGRTKSSRVELVLKDHITSGLSWLEEAQQMLHRLYSQSNLEALVNGWSYIRLVPVLAYVCIEDVTSRGDILK